MTVPPISRSNQSGEMPRRRDLSGLSKGVTDSGRIPLKFVSQSQKSDYRKNTEKHSFEQKKREEDASDAVFKQVKETWIVKR